MKRRESSRFLAARHRVAAAQQPAMPVIVEAALYRGARCAGEARPPSIEIAIGQSATTGSGQRCAPMMEEREN